MSGLGAVPGGGDDGLHIGRGGGHTLQQDGGWAGTWGRSQVEDHHVTMNTITRMNTDMSRITVRGITSRQGERSIGAPCASRTI